MESNSATTLFFLIGLFGIIAGLALWNTSVFSGFLVGFGGNWLVAGFALMYAGREVTDTGFLLALVLGIVGVVLWLQVEPPQKTFEARPLLREGVIGEKVRCKDCLKFGHRSCIRTNTWAEALPCGEFE